MISKITGYSGFRPYGELPYPTLKQGKQLELANKIWETTVRQTDHIDPLQNYHHNKTVYIKSYLQNTYPEHYHPEHVAKGAHKTTNFDNAATIPAYDKQQAQKYQNAQTEEIGDPRKLRLLKTGTQHWKTVYQQNFENGNKELNSTNNNFNNNDPQNIESNGNRASQNHFATKGNNIVNGKTNVDNNISSIRSHSLGGKSKVQFLEEQARKNSYKCKPYINNAKTGVTDYKFNYGQKIGDSPMGLMNMVSIKQPFRDHPLKRGTNQMWTEIPNYQGFKPSELTFKQYEQKIKERQNIRKGNLKLQTTENFHVQTPGYGGFKPKFQTTTAQLRENLLSTSNFKKD